MSGHSKWSTIRHKKGAADAKRGKLFTKIIKEISAAARSGSDPDSNPRLRTAIANAKSANMPNDNITRAIKKGAGDLGGASYETVTYEGYGPGGTAILVQVLTDNKNRTVSEIRHLFSRSGGNLGETGCVSWMFIQKGVVIVEQGKIAEEKLMDIILEAGADDMETEDGFYNIYMDPSLLDTVRTLIESKGVGIYKSEVSMEPQTTVKLTGKDAETVIKLMEKLEDHDDVQNAYANFDIDEEEMAKILGE
ncbi:MAG: YebC/PmpR family DNA-binding transcriptional regulator [Oligoflexia bacterium]|nr:YebC/PmpR family DNA-binding transcriptional regulator [Oligoflexia bacterium]